MGSCEITNTAKAGYLALAGADHVGEGQRDRALDHDRPRREHQPSGSSPAAFLDLMITHVGASSAASTRLRLTCSLGTDPGTKVAALSCIGLR